MLLHGLFLIRLCAIKLLLNRFNIPL